MFVVIWEDRHSDTEVYVFSKASYAIKWAAKWAHESDKHGFLVEKLTDAMIKDGWLYYGCYSPEGCHIRVVECTVDSHLN